MFGRRDRYPQTKSPGLYRSRLRYRLGGSLILLSLLALSACKKSDAALEGLAPPPVLDESVVPESERARDEFWQRASSGDFIELTRLAEREGAAGLLEGLEEGGVVGLTALLALPHVEDAELAYRRLGEIILQLDAKKAAPVVEAALAMAQRPWAHRELLDPPGKKYCAEALLELTKKRRAPSEVKAAAISALRLLAERNLVSLGEIPEEADP